MRIRLWLLLVSLQLFYKGVFAQNNQDVYSTSPTYRAQPEQKAAPLQAAAKSKNITFSEYPVHTVITDQYQNIGIFFGPNTFISTDGSNPTSPVLSGTPRFNGPINGQFVIPGTTTPATVQSFSLAAGYFDDIGSTRIVWFDAKGKILGQKINSHLGIETFEIKGGDIASFTISVVANEPAGYAIDNISFEPLGSSVVFRETHSQNQNRLFGIFTGELPGFDHTALNASGIVLESHPGYHDGEYVSQDGNESVQITQENGVQWQFTKATFKWESVSTGASDVIDFAEVPIEDQLASTMRTFIESKGSYAYPDFINNVHSIYDIFERSSPERQKGLVDQTFTCVGLVERAAEEAGHNGGKGFVPNQFEYIEVEDPRNKPNKIKIPLLVPTFLLYNMRYQDVVAKSKQWIAGLFDPVDFLITDPLGRRLGFVQDSGLINEIPNAFYNGDGSVEQIFIPTALPGPYRITFYGKNASMFAGLASQNSALSFADSLSNGQTVQKNFFVDIKPGNTGDVNGDGLINNDDIIALSAKLNRFTNGLGEPGDIDGDGLISNNDIKLLQQLIPLVSCNLSNITASNDTTVYYGYPPLAGATLSVNGIPAAELSDYQFLWNTGSTNSSIIVYPSQPSNYTVTISKGGCIKKEEIAVNVIDVRCGKNLDKVLICHKSNSVAKQTLCISQNDVSNHLAHGDVLNTCIQANGVGENTARSITQPSNDLENQLLDAKILANQSNILKLFIGSNSVNNNIQLRVSDILGRLVEVKHNITPNQIYSIGVDYRKGIYFIEITQGRERKIIKFLKN